MPLYYQNVCKTSLLASAHLLFNIMLIETLISPKFKTHHMLQGKIIRGIISLKINEKKQDLLSSSLPLSYSFFACLGIYYVHWSHIEALINAKIMTIYIFVQKRKENIMQEEIDNQHIQIQINTSS